MFSKHAEAEEAGVIRGIVSLWNVADRRTAVLTWISEYISGCPCSQCRVRDESCDTYTARVCRPDVNADTMSQSTSPSRRSVHWIIILSVSAYLCLYP